MKNEKLKALIQKSKNFSEISNQKAVFIFGGNSGSDSTRKPYNPPPKGCDNAGSACKSKPKH